MKKKIGLRDYWLAAFYLLAVLSLSSMAGMSIGYGIFVLATLLVLVKFWREKEGQYFRALLTSPFAILSLLFLIIAIASLISARLDPPLGLPLEASDVKKFHYFLYPIFVAMALEFSGRENSKFWKCWMAIGFLNAAIAVVQFWGRSIFPEAWLSARFFRQAGDTAVFHGQGLMYFHLSFAACMSFVASAGLARALWPRKEDSSKQRVLWLLLGLAGCLATFYSFSRIAWVAIFVLVACLGFLKRPKWGLATLCLLTLFSYGLWKENNEMRVRWSEAFHGKYEREGVWLASWTMFKDRPMLGVGFGKTGQYSSAYGEKATGKKPRFSSHAHNNYLDVMASTGILGLAIFLAWWGFLVGAAWKAFRASEESERWLPAAALAGFLAFHINGLTQVNFWDGKSEHTLMIWCGVVLMLWMRGRKSKVGA